MSSQGTRDPGAEEHPERDTYTRWFLDTAKDAAAAIDDSSDRACVVAQVAGAQAQAGDLAGAMETAAGIQEAWDKAMAYCSIAEAQARSGDRAAPRRTINLAERAAVDIEEASVKTLAQCDIAETQARTGDFQSAMATAAAIGDRQQKAWAYISIAEAYAAVGDMAAFREALELALRLGLATISDPSSLAALYADIAAAQAHAGDFAAALRTAAQIEVEAGRLSRRWHYGRLTAPADALGVRAEARAYVAVYLSLAWTEAKARNTPASREAFTNAREFARRNPDASDRALAYASIASTQARAGDFSAALDTVANMELGWAKVCAYWCVAHAQPKAGNRESFEQAVELGQQTEAEVREAMSQVETRSETDAAQAEADDSASEAATPPGIDTIHKGWAYEEMGAAWAEAGEVENLKSWVETLTDPIEVVSACLGAVKGLQGEEDESGE